MVALSHRLAHAAYELHASIERCLHDTLVELDLTLPLADALWQLDPARAPMSRRELAARLSCDPSNVTFLVDRLERRRLVERAQAPGDRRVRTLALTTPGVRARERLVTTIAQAGMFSRLTAGEQRQLAGLLTRCLDEAR